ncbi:hypothetical protein [Nocardia asteroides]|uniref:hypothetical protein n=1 Tax=Nocardia asteroides TaxID=1824 RepID=UPI003645F6F1
MSIIPDQPSELILTESRTMRAQTIERTDVFDKVKALALLPDGAHATTEIVAGYYEVGVETIKSLVKDHRAELAENGLRVLAGEELRSFKDLCHIESRARSLAVFSRRAILNVGQLLTESDIARQVRTYLLEVEEQAAPEVRSEAADLVALAESRMRVLKAAAGIVDAAWLETKARLVAARALGEEPEVDPLDAPLYVPDFLRGKGLNRRDIESVQSWFGRRAASLYEAEHGEKPGKRQSDLPNGSVRETYAWTQRHVGLFEETWDRYYAAQFPTQLDLGGAA